MQQPKQRVMVDGIEFASILRFPRILRSVTSALQPGRLAIGLLMVTALVTLGRLWDRLAPPVVSPAGLLAGPMDDDEREQADRTVLAALMSYAGSAPPEVTDRPHLRARAALHVLREACERRCAEGGDRQAEGTAFLQAARRIDAVRPKGVFEATFLHLSASLMHLVRGIVVLDGNQFVNQGVAGFLVQLPVALWKDHALFAIVYGALFLLVVAVGGGALSRLAACQWATGQRLTVREAFDYAIGNWWKTFSALVLPLLLAGVTAACILLLGLLMRLPWAFDLLGALAYGPALLLGAIVAFMVLGYALGMPMLVPAVACENCDGPDAQQRAYAYLVNRPLHFLGYGLVALLGLAIGFVIVKMFAVVTLNGTALAFTAWSGEHPALGSLGSFSLFEPAPAGEGPVPLSAGDRAAHGVLMFWQTLVLCLVPAYVLSYLFTAATKVYLLMRLACDGQDVEEIWRSGLEPGTYVPAPEVEGGGKRDWGQAGAG